VRPGTQLSLAENEELIISGQCVSEGYVKDEQRSNAVFKDINDRRSYFTGDKATVQDDLWFITGRIDFQVKLNGYRMELEEIEFHLRQVDIVKEAIVVPVYRNNKVTQLQGVVVLNDLNNVKDEQTLIHDIKQELKQAMPEYMIPRKIIFKEQFPLTINGKLDRKQIAEDVLT